MTDHQAESARLTAEVVQLRRALLMGITALDSVVSGASQTYQARNGRYCTIQAEDGERCDIIHSDITVECQGALRDMRALASAPTQATDGE